MSILAEELKRVKGLERTEWEKWSDVRVEEDFLGDIRPRVMEMVRRILESGMEIEVNDLIGSRRWEHNYTRSTYRNGSYVRNLLTSYGYIQNIRVPRVRDGEIKLKVLPRYKRRSAEVDEQVLKMFLAGVSTRRVDEVIGALIGGTGNISASTVSKIAKRLDRYVARYHNRYLDDDYLYLILDGVYLNIKSPIHKRRRVVLVCYGIKKDGKRELIDFELAVGGESENAWVKFLNGLYHRGLKGEHLRLATIDGNKGLRNALDYVYPNVKVQRCWAHKLRNVSNRLPKRSRDICVNEARHIYQQETYDDAVYAFRKWFSAWEPIYPEAVKSIEDDLEELLNFYEQPLALRIKLRTTNIIERVFREVRRRTRPMSCFNNRASVERIIFAILTRQNNLWKDNPLFTNFSQLTQNT